MLECQKFPWQSGTIIKFAKVQFLGTEHQEYMSFLDPSYQNICHFWILHIRIYFTCDSIVVPQIKHEFYHIYI